MVNDNNFISIPKAAEKCGVDRRTMWRWVKSHKIDSFQTPGGHHRILRSSLDDLLKEGFSKTGDTKKVILVVDDDEAVCRTLKKRLTREDYHVETESDGFKAGMKVRDLKPDLIILDLKMEGIDGFEVCRTIRADSSLKDTKVLVMTGYGTPENRERAMQEGADDFLSKGDTFNKILQHIHALLADKQYRPRNVAEKPLIGGQGGRRISPSVSTR